MTQCMDAAKAPGVFRHRAGKAARESSAVALGLWRTPKEQPPPESLRPKDRARLTVWKVPAKSPAGHRRGKLA